VALAVKEVNAEGAPVTAPITTGVAETVLDALRAAINRRLRELFYGLGRSLRNIVWPVLLFSATYGIFELSVNIQSYLHAEHKNIQAVLTFIAPAAIWGLVSVFALAFSAALVLFKWRVADNTLRFVGLIGFIVLLTFWIFSLALWGFNVLLEQFNANVVRPFDPPSWATAASAIALVIFGGYVLLSERGRQLVNRQSSTSRPVAAATIRAADVTTPSAPSDGQASQPTSAQE
jgi:amino acid transporter